MTRSGRPSASGDDAATKRQLDRGKLTVEVLKQGQYAPMVMEQQVMIIYAVTNGLMDDVNPNTVKEWETGFHSYMSASHPEIGESIATEKALTKPNEQALRDAVAMYKKVAAPAAAR